MKLVGFRSIVHVLAWAVGGTLVFAPVARPAEPQNRNRAARALGELSNEVRELSAAISPSVVQITATGYGIGGNEEQGGVSIFSRQRSTGSGIVVSADGYIITNAHVIEGARSIRVKLNGQRRAQDSLFDQLFRKHLQNVYLALGEVPPGELLHPIHLGRQPQRPHTQPTGLLDVKIDGRRLSKRHRCFGSSCLKSTASARLRWNGLASGSTPRRSRTR